MKQLIQLIQFLGIVTLALGLISNLPAQAITFFFAQRSFSGVPFVSGTFSGTDTNNNNILEINELTNFESQLVGNSFSFLEDDLTNFEYLLGTRNSIFFNLQKTVEVFDGFANYEEYMLTVNGFASFSQLAIYYYLDLNDDPFAVADGASNQPVRVFQQSTSIPEPSSRGGLIFLGLFGWATRKFLITSA